MASPQLENGFMRVATEIMEALARIRIPGEARQVVDVVFRKTYGFNKKEDHISLSQFCLSTGMRKGDVCRAINKAEDMKLILSISKKANQNGNMYCINKDFDTWKPLAKKRRGYAKKLIIVSKKANNRMLKSDIQKTKDIPIDNTAAAPPFVWENYLARMEEHKQRHVQVIAFYFKKKRIMFDSLQKAQVGIKRHLRAAKDLANFSDQEISKALSKAQADYPEFTIETVTKILTR